MAKPVLQAFDDGVPHRYCCGQIYSGIVATQNVLMGGVMVAVTGDQLALMIASQYELYSGNVGTYDGGSSNKLGGRGAMMKDATQTATVAGRTFAGNPKLIILPYDKGVVKSDTKNVLPAGYYALNAAGSHVYPVGNPYALTYIGRTGLPAASGYTNWSSYHANAISKVLYNTATTQNGAGSIDGVWLDTEGPAGQGDAVWWPGSGNSGVIDGPTIVGWTNQSNLAVAAAIGPDAYVAANGVRAKGTPFFGLVNGADLVMWENWGGLGTIAVNERPTDGQFQTMAQTILDVNAAGTDFQALLTMGAAGAIVTTTGMRGCQEFYTALFMLGCSPSTSGKAVFDWALRPTQDSPWTTGEMMNPLYDAFVTASGQSRLGNCVHGYTSITDPTVQVVTNASGSLYVKYYAHGAILVNSSNASIGYGIDGRTYTDLFSGASVGKSVTVPAGTARYLYTTDVWAGIGGGGGGGGGGTGTGGLPIGDLFGVASASGFPPLTTGAAPWGYTIGAEGDFSSSGGRGEISHGGANTGKQATLAIGVMDVDSALDVIFNAAIAGGNHFAYNIARRQTNGDYYRLTVQYVSATGEIQATLQSVIGGVAATLAGPINITSGGYTPGTLIHTRLVVLGGSLSGYVSLGAAALPASPNLGPVTNTDIASSGDIGIGSYRAAGNTNTQPFLLVDNYSAVAATAPPPPPSTVLPVVERFDGTSTSGWGALTTGTVPWSYDTGAPADFTTLSGVGQIQNPASGVRLATLDVAAADVDCRLDVRFNDVIAGGNYFVYSDARMLANGDYYRIQIQYSLSLNGVQYSVQKVVGGVATALAPSVVIAAPYTPGTTIHTHLVVQGTTVQATAWIGATEPSPDFVLNDTSVSGAGKVGIGDNRAAGNTNAQPFVELDNYFVSVPNVDVTAPTVTVTSPATSPFSVPFGTTSLAIAGQITDDVGVDHVVVTNTNATSGKAPPQGVLLADQTDPTSPINTNFLTSVDGFTLTLAWSQLEEADQGGTLNGIDVAKIQQAIDYCAAHGFRFVIRCFSNGFASGGGNGDRGTPTWVKGDPAVPLYGHLNNQQDPTTDTAPILAAYWTSAFQSHYERFVNSLANLTVTYSDGSGTGPLDAEPALSGVVMMACHFYYGEPFILDPATGSLGDGSSRNTRELVGGGFGWLKQYAQLAAPLSATYTGNITVKNRFGSGMAAIPFNAWIDTERVTISAVSGTTWTISARGVGSSSAAAHKTDAFLNVILPASAADVTIAAPGAGWTQAAYLAALTHGIDVHLAAFTQTPCLVAYNPLQQINADGSHSIVGTPTSIIDYHAAQAGSRCVLSNTGAGPVRFVYDAAGNPTGISATDSTGKIYSYFLTKKRAMMIQTMNQNVILGSGSWAGTIQQNTDKTIAALDQIMGANGSEPPPNFQNWATPSEVANWNAALDQNAIPGLTGGASVSVPVSGTSAPYSATVPLVPGRNVIQVVGYDTSQNVSGVVTRIVDVAPDVTAPQIRLTNPNTGTATGSATLASTVSSFTLQLTATDLESGVAGVVVTVGGVDQPLALSGGVYSYAITGIAVGTRSYPITVTDNAGNTSTGSITITRQGAGDTTAPVITMSTPASGTAASGTASVAFSATSVTLAGTATDNVAVASLTAVEAGGTPVAVTVGAGGAFTYPVTALAAGESRTVVLTATDAAGNAKTATITVTRAADKTAPALAVSTVAGAAWTPGATVTLPAGATTVALTGTASDAESGLNRISAWAYDAAGAPHPAVQASASPWSLTVAGLTVGTNTVTVAAYDNATNQVSLTITVVVPVAPTVPTLRGTSITDATQANRFQVGDSLVATVIVATGSPTSYAWSWFRSGSSTVIRSATTTVPYDTRPAVAADVAHTLTARVIASDANGPSSPSTSAATPPIVAAPTVAPTLLTSVTIIDVNG